MHTEAHLFSVPNDCLWYDKLWGPSQRVVTLFFLFSSANILTPHPYSCHEMKLWILTLEADILGTPMLRLVVRGPGTEVQRPHGGLWGSHAMAGHGGTLAVVAPQV